MLHRVVRPSRSGRVRYTSFKGSSPFFVDCHGLACGGSDKAEYAKAGCRRNSGVHVAGYWWLSGYSVHLPLVRDKK